MRYILVLVCLSLLSACGTGGFGSSYRAYVNPKLSPDLEALPEKGEPTVIRSTDLDRDVRFYREHNYVVVGESAFNGLQESEGNARRQAQEVGATHVIIAAAYTDTQSQLNYDYQDYYRTYFVRDVTYVDGRPVPTRRAVTVRDTVAVPYTRHYNNYDQWGVFMVKSNRAPGLGLVLRDLTGPERQTFKRNTGSYIDVVLSNSPAFQADIVSGNVIVAVNNTKVNDTSHAHSMISELKQNGQDITLTIIREGKQVNVGFGVVEGSEPVPDLPQSVPPENVAPESESDWVNPDEVTPPKAESVSF